MAGSFIRVTGKESADFAAASAFSLPTIPTERVVSFQVPDIADKQ